MRRLTFKIRSLLAITLLVSLGLALSRDIPFVELHHGSFELPPNAEISVYEFYDDPHFGKHAASGIWNVECRWVNRGENHWTPINLRVTLENVMLHELSWGEPQSCWVSGSMASVINAKHVRENGAYPIPVPWSEEPIAADSGFIGEYDEFWNMKYTLLIVDYGVVLVAGNGDDGSFQYKLGRNDKGQVCAVECILEDDPDYWLQSYYSHSRLKRMWWNFIQRLDG